MWTLFVPFDVFVRNDVFGKDIQTVPNNFLKIKENLMVPFFLNLQTRTNMLGFFVLLLLLLF